MKKNTILLIIALFILSPAAAIDYDYKAPVEKAEKSNFYKIRLSPEITRHLKPDFSDIRVYGNNAEIPYILYEEQQTKEQELFVEYKIIDKQHFKQQRYTRIVIHNAAQTSINNFVIQVRNADVRKKLKLNGSDNKKDWYVIKDNYAYNSIPGTQNTSEIRVLNFPMSNYEYYELLIDDYYDKPINIIRAGYYNRVKEKGKYTLLENTAYQTSQQKDETVIKIPLNGKYADRITFEIAAPRYYLRHARLYTKATTKYKKKVRTHEYTVKHVHLVSNSGNSFAIDNINADTLFVNIKNLDDAPLEIGKINLYQLNKYLLAELNGGEYYLMYGNKKATKPNYDIKYFTDSIPRHVQTIGTKPAQYIAKPAHVTESNNFNMSTVWLWIIILSVAALLFYMSVKMINDNKKNSR